MLCIKGWTPGRKKSIPVPHELNQGFGYGSRSASWIRIRIRVKSCLKIRIRIKVEIQELSRLKMEPWRADRRSKCRRGGLKWRPRGSQMRITLMRSRIRIRIEVKSLYLECWPSSSSHFTDGRNLVGNSSCSSLISFFIESIFSANSFQQLVLPTSLSIGLDLLIYPNNNGTGTGTCAIWYRMCSVSHSHTDSVC